MIPHQKPIFNLHQTDEKGLQEATNYQDFQSATHARTCCFYLFKHGEGHRCLPQGEEREPWWVRTGKKLKEWSEFAARPRWMTFLRRFGCGNGGNGGRKATPSTYYYDLESYLLNFDGDGCGGQEQADQCPLFSSRFACPFGKGSSTAPS